MLPDRGDRTHVLTADRPRLDHVQHTASSSGTGENGGHRFDCLPRKRWGRLHCPGCRAQWAKDRQISILHPLSEYSGRVAMITVTAPGADQLPWSCEHDHDRHSGRLGCRVRADEASRWNASAPRRWSMMWQNLRNDLRLSGLLVLVKVWEPQARGVGHLHVVVPLVHHRVLVEWLKAHAQDYGFGFVDDGRTIPPGSPAQAAGAYVASYIGSGGKVETVCEAIKDGVIPSRSFYVSPAVANGCTMRHLRLKRRAWAVVFHGAAIPWWCDAENWGRALEGIGWSSSGSDPPL